TGPPPARAATASGGRDGIRSWRLPRFLRRRREGPRLLQLRKTGVGAPPVREQTLVMAAGGGPIPQRRRGACEPEQRERAVGPPFERPLELRRRVTRASELEERLPEELRRGLDGLRRSQGRRKLLVQRHRLLQPCDRVAAPAAGERP